MFLGIITPFTVNGTLIAIDFCRGRLVPAPAEINGKTLIMVNSSGTGPYSGACDEVLPTGKWKVQDSLADEFACP